LAYGTFVRKIGLNNFQVATGRMVRDINRRINHGDRNNRYRGFMN